MTLPVKFSSELWESKSHSLYPFDSLIYMRDIQGRSFPRARILLADDHRATLLAIESFLKTDYDVVGALRNCNVCELKVS